MNRNVLKANTSLHSENYPEKALSIFTIHMDPRQSISIKVEWNGQEFPLEVSLSATIREVKDMIYNSIGIPIAEQELLYLGQRSPSDEKTVQQYGITNDSELLLLRKFELTINLPNRENVWRTVDEDFTVGEVKASLVSEVGVQDIEATALQLTDDDGSIVTVDDRAYLWAAGIVDSTHLRLVNLNL